MKAKLKTVYDNGGEKFFDRYTVVFTDGSVFRMSHNADSPQGFCQYIGEAEEFDFNEEGSPLGKEILPQGVCSAISNLLSNLLRGDD